MNFLKTFLKSWLAWVVGLVCTLGWTCATITYLFHWEIGYIFLILTLTAIALVYFGEAEANKAHRLEIKGYKLQLAAAEEARSQAVQIQEEQAVRLQQRDQILEALTNQFLDRKTHRCRDCGAKNVWHFTQFKFHPSVHAHGCMVVQSRALIEPQALWLPQEFRTEYLDEQWAEDLSLRRDRAFADFFDCSDLGEDGKRD